MANVEKDLLIALNNYIKYQTIKEINAAIEIRNM